jgi:7,8-dihydroneopterin aldolase/epimerase/oxygenase
MIGWVALEGLEFHAFHGVYPHERESGNYFEVDIAVQTDFGDAAKHDDLNGTVNYEALFRIVKDEMEQPSRLLETVAEKIVRRVLNECPSVLEVDIKISKLSPPIGGKCRRSAVSICRKKD